MFSEIIRPIVFLIVVLPYIESASRHRLNEYIEHYEGLEYDPDVVHEHHLRTRRFTDTQDELRLNFTAHGRRFSLHLQRDLTTFSDDFKIEGSNGELLDVDISHLYHGKLTDDPQSRVFGSVTDGVFEGKIVASDGAFYVEQARRYLPPNRTRTRVHSVIYREGDVTDPYAHRRHGHVSGCGITDELMRWMGRIQNPGVNYEPMSLDELPAAFTASSASLGSRPNSLRDDLPRFGDIQHENKYSRAANTAKHRRMRRAAGGMPTSNYTTCTIYIRTDPLLWQHVRQGLPDHEISAKKNEVDRRTRNEITSLIHQHVQAVNQIFSDTEFVGRYHHKTIKLVVLKVKIDNDSLCMDEFMREKNQFCDPNIDVSNFLNLHSLDNHDDFCLAYVFTYRDFLGGTLGLAWVASASSGGVCENYQNNKGTMQSLNTGLITFVNYNSRVPPKISHLTFAHEIGHNFGSPHDYPPECRPGGQDGNFLMFASATSGELSNNNKFSSCSKGNISVVLDAIADGRKNNCFIATDDSICGNKIVEDGEECDCGYDDTDCDEKCCYPHVLSDSDRKINPNAKGCTRKPNFKCSPSEGMCCDVETCDFIPASRRKKCREVTECRHVSVCSGNSARCPNGTTRADFTKCNFGTQLCNKGECSLSICHAWNMTECFLSSAPQQRGAGLSAVANRRTLCQLACQTGPGADTCQSSAVFAHRVGLPEGGISLRPGSPCDNFQGYCDVFLQCRAVDMEGPLARLKNLLLNRSMLQSLEAWITEKLWAVLLAGVAFFISMGLLIKCCAVHTPSSNPKLPPRRMLSETLQWPINALQHPSHNAQRVGPAHGGPLGASANRDRDLHTNAYPQLYEMRALSNL